jgi:hypothetical protein
MLKVSAMAMPGQHPARGVHARLDLGHRRVVGEQQKVARLAEVLLSGEEVTEATSSTPFGGHQRQAPSTAWCPPMQ